MSLLSKEIQQRSFSLEVEVCLASHCCTLNIVGFEKTLSSKGIELPQVFERSQNKSGAVMLWRRCTYRLSFPNIQLKNKVQEFLFRSYFQRGGKDRSFGIDEYSFSV